MKRVLNFFKSTVRGFSNDKATTLAAALAYYTIFSVAPLLLIAIAIAGLVFGRAQAQAQIVGQLRAFMGNAGAAAIEQMLANSTKAHGSIWAIVIGAVILLLGAAGVFMQLKQSLNMVWNVPQQKIAGGIKGFIRQRLLAFGMVFAIGFLLLVSLVSDAAISSFARYANTRLPGGEGLWQGIQLGISFVVITVLFALMFRFLPDIRVEWRDVWFGAAFTSVLFIIGKYLMALYVGRGSVGSSFGAAGSLVVLLVWIYWSSNIFLFGAEFTQVYARSHGSRQMTGTVEFPDLPGEEKPRRASGR